MSDWQLLREYVEHKSNAAFSRLVDKHMSLVYWTCRRSVRDAQTAEDAALTVFLLLARKAGSLSKGTSISGWLFNASRLVSRNAARYEARFRLSEEAVMRIMQDAASPGAGTPEIEAWLDDAIASLPSTDRDVILLRFYDGLSYQEIAREMGATENTVTKRAARAVEKMRRHFERRKVTVGSVALMGLLAQEMAKPVPDASRNAVLQTIHSLPAGLPLSGLASGHVALFQKGVHITMQTMKYKVAITGIAAALIVGGIVAVPVSLKAGQAKSSWGTVNVSAAATVKPADSTEAAVLQEIQEDMRDGDNRMLDGVRPRPPYVAQNHTSTQDGVTTVHTDAFIANEAQHNQALLKSFEHPVISDVVTALRVTGDTSIVASRLSVSGLITSNTSGIGKMFNVAPGSEFSINQEVVESRWKKVSGRWILQSETDKSPTFTVSKDGQSVTMDWSGRELSRTSAPAAPATP